MELNVVRACLRDFFLSIRKFNLPFQNVSDIDTVGAPAMCSQKSLTGFVRKEMTCGLNRGDLIVSHCISHHENWGVKDAAFAWRLLFLINVSSWLNCNLQLKMPSQHVASLRHAYYCSPSVCTRSSPNGQPRVRRNDGILQLNINAATKTKLSILQQITPSCNAAVALCRNAPSWPQKPIRGWIVPCSARTKCNSLHCRVRQTWLSCNYH